MSSAIIKIPREVSFIISTLEDCGHSAYIVGGCVRDSLMKKTPTDWDIASSALPWEVKEVFEGYKIIDTGLAHGTVTLLINKVPYEITSFRSDGEYSDNRHPDKVSFVSDIKADLSRRDFTINAMAYRKKEGLIDLFSGQKDIEDRLIRTVGEADLRFNEDALRIFRALRFASVLDFKIEEKTALSIHKNKNSLQNIAKERIRLELEKLLMGVGLEKVLTDFADVLLLLIPQLEKLAYIPHTAFGSWRHRLKALSLADFNLHVRLAILLHNIPPEDENSDECGKTAEDILKNLRFDNKTVLSVSTLIKNYKINLEPTGIAVKNYLKIFGVENLERLISVKTALFMADATENSKGKLKKIRQIKEILHNVLESKFCFSFEGLDIGGQDLLEIGFKEGRELGEVLNILLDLVINEQIANNKQKLLKTAFEIRNRTNKMKY